ncbi:DMT family transporter [Desulfobacula sp.]|uniref:DMT family transporter n=1 Tax=Desulfobacula sp. TaxID=2593537 RepID=UPI001ECEEAEA|nr:DMT family transporter [Desulfobacula sp.]
MKKAYILGLLTVLFWSTSATAFKLTLRYLDVLPLLFYAIVTATLILAGYLLITGNFSAVFRLQPQEYLLCLILGILNPFIHYWMAIKAYDLLPAQIVQPINYTWIITLVLLSVPLLKQSLSRKDIFATLVCYAGVVVVSIKTGTSDSITMNYFGVFLALSCTFIWALYWIYNVRLKRDPIVGIFLNFLFCIPFVLFACLWFSSLKIEYMEGLFGAIWIGCFEFGFTFITWISALRLSKQTSKITNLIFLTPFVSLIFIHFILGEYILWKTLIGLILIITGLVVQKQGKGQ